MSDKSVIITGGRHTDLRGTLSFVNDFDMSPVKRMYMISHSDTEIRRGWRAHKIEQRWFHVVKGSFEIKLARIDDWEKPNPDLELESYILSADQPQVIHLPAGYASGFRALVPDSDLMVFADSNIGDAVNDDYQYPIEYFNNWK